LPVPAAGFAGLALIHNTRAKRLITDNRCHK
jgi:hypothetical protein